MLTVNFGPLRLKVRVSQLSTCLHFINQCTLGRGQFFIVYESIVSKLPNFARN